MQIYEKNKNLPHFMDIEQMCFQQCIKQIWDLKKKIKKITRKKQMKIRSVKLTKLQKCTSIDLKVFIHKKKINNIVNNHQEIVCLSPAQFSYFDHQQLKKLRQIAPKIVEHQLNLQKDEKIGDNYMEKLTVECSISDSDRQIEKQDNNKQIMVKNVGIPSFWSFVMANTLYSQSFTHFDKCLLQFLKSIKIQTPQKNEQASEQNISVFSQGDEGRIGSVFQLQLQIIPGHDIVHPGLYSKFLSINAQGQPYKYTGNQIISRTTRRMKKGFFKLLLSNTTQPIKLAFILDFFQIFKQEVMPYSLQYYLRKGEKITSSNSSNRISQQINQSQNDEKQFTRNHYQRTMG